MVRAHSERGLAAHTAGNAEREGSLVEVTEATVCATVVPVKLDHCNRARRGLLPPGGRVRVRVRVRVRARRVSCHLGAGRKGWRGVCSSPRDAYIRSRRGARGMRRCRGARGRCRVNHCVGGKGILRTHSSIRLTGLTAARACTSRGPSLGGILRSD